MPVQVGVGLSLTLFPLGDIGVTGAGTPDAPSGGGNTLSWRGQPVTWRGQAVTWR